MCVYVMHTPPAQLHVVCARCGGGVSLYVCTGVSSSALNCSMCTHSVASTVNLIKCPYVWYCVLCVSTWYSHSKSQQFSAVLVYR